MVAEKHQATQITSVYGVFKDYFLAIAGAAIMALLLRVYVIEAFRIPTDFMAPMLLPGDHIFVDKLAYVTLPALKRKAPARGDVIIFSFPNDPSKDYIKRVIAVAGDTVELRDSRVLINGKVISRVLDSTFEEDLYGRRYIVQWKNASADSRKMTAVKVPDDQVFVLGDNRAKGQDSRSYGFLPTQNIKGRAWVIWFSLGSEGSKNKVRWSRLFARVN